MTASYDEESGRRCGEDLMEPRRCSVCGRENDPDRLISACGRMLCPECMYAGSEPLSIYPIGYVRNGLSRPAGAFGLSGDKNSVSRIELFPSQKMFMHKLEEEENITVVYYLHDAMAPKEKFRRGLDGKEVGVFASRTPHRLSRIAVTEVMLVKISGTTLFVRGLDAINGSPVLDIKLGRKSIDRNMDA